MSFLLAVTTLLPALSALRTQPPAGSSPPANSTTTSTSEASTASASSLHTTLAGTQSTPPNYPPSQSQKERCAADAACWNRRGNLAQTGPKLSGTMRKDFFQARRPPPCG